jgi:hypothetical protein
MTYVITRRRLLQATAAATPVILVGCGDDSGIVPDGGRTDGGRTDGGGPGDGGNTDGNTEAPDVLSLNALLSAEYAAVKAYDAGAAILMAPPAGDPFAGLAATALGVAARFQQQHRDHADVLANAITTMRGTPVDEATIMFTPPTGFSASVMNVLKLACNAEKAASIAYNQTIMALMDPQNRVLASAIEGDETQHFIVLYAILKGVAAPGPEIAMVDRIVPTSFVTTVMSEPGLETVPPLAFT